MCFLCYCHILIIVILDKKLLTVGYSNQLGMKMKNLQLLSLIALLTISLAACNTIEGAGQDIEAGGDAIEGSARETKGY